MILWVLGEMGVKHGVRLTILLALSCLLGLANAWNLGGTMGGHSCSDSEGQIANGERVWWCETRSGQCQIVCKVQSTGSDSV